MDWLGLLSVQGTLKSLLQHHSSKASILQCSAFFIVQLSHPYMTTGKTITLTRRTFVGKAMSLLFNMLSRLVIAFLTRSNCLLISWLHSPSSVILEPPKTVCHCFHSFPIYLPWSDGTRCHDLTVAHSRYTVNQNFSDLTSDNICSELPPWCVHNPSPPVFQSFEKHFHVYIWKGKVVFFKY